MYMASRRQANVEEIRRLIEEIGADTRATDIAGRTFLHYWSQTYYYSGSMNVIDEEMLSATDYLGRTPLMRFAQA